MNCAGRSTWQVERFGLVEKGWVVGAVKWERGEGGGDVRGGGGRL